MIAVICHKVVIVFKPMGRETDLAKYLKVFFFFYFFLLFMLLLFHVAFPLLVIQREKGNSLGWFGF